MLVDIAMQLFEIFLQHWIAKQCSEVVDVLTDVLAGSVAISGKLKATNPRMYLANIRMRVFEVLRDVVGVGVCISDLASANRINGNRYRTLRWY